MSSVEEMPDLLKSIRSEAAEPEVKKEVPSTFKHKTYKMEGPTDSYRLNGRSPAPIEEADLVSSEVDDGGSLHTVILDIDMPAALVPSTTPDHYHLYIDRPMTWRQYKKLLKALAKAGVIEKGYAGVSIARGATQVRLPWVKKPL